MGCFGLAPLSLGLPVFGDEAKEGEASVPQTTEELRHAIAEVLKAFQVSGASIVLVSRDEVLWTAEIGLADRAKQREVAPETMFRAGSISKSFVVLAALKLQEEGKLKLEDRVADLGATTSSTIRGKRLNRCGWSTCSNTPPDSMNNLFASLGRTFRTWSLRDGLAFDSRAAEIAMAAGPLLFVFQRQLRIGGVHRRADQRGRASTASWKTKFSRPKMKVSFLQTDTVREHLATGYGGDGMTEVPYEHMLGRASGALNTTPGELAHLVQMLLNRGTYGGVQAAEARVD